MSEKGVLRQIEIVCICGNKISATVFRDITFDLTCAKCGLQFLEEETSEAIRRIFYIRKTDEQSNIIVEFKGDIKTL